MEVWRNRVFSTQNRLHRAADWVTRWFGPSPYHLLLLVRYPDEHTGPGDYGRYEIFEPCTYGDRRGDYGLPTNLGGFLQRRFVSSRLRTPDPEPDPVWDFHRVWRREYPADHPALQHLTEAALSRYRFRDHYPHFFDNVTGKSINSNTFVEAALEAAGITEPDGRALDLTSGGRFHHPGLGLGRGFEFAFDGDTSTLHGEWNRLHGFDRFPRQFLWRLTGRPCRGRFVRASPSS